MDSLGRNITLPIYNANGTSFHGLELKKFTFDSVVMALGDKITGELYYSSNTLSVNQTEYVVYDGVKYYLINPPTIVKEGMKADNGSAKGMTKYSFTFYHPMFMLYNFPFTDVAVTSSEEKYKSQDKNFFWIGNLVDYVAKLNKNLTGTEWVVEIGSNVPVQDKNKLSEVLSFNDQKIADALKTGYDTWEIPYIIDVIASTDSRYAQGKRFLIRYGLPSQEILVENAQHQNVPYVFQMGQGVGLKNDSRTPKNNKIITRIAGYGSEDNVPFGYPQIIWTGDQTWNYTINNSASADNSYPIYDGIVAGQRVRLIHHPFTRSHLMPTIYADTVNKKVNPYASGYDPTIEIKDYYDAVNDSSWTYPNQIISNAPSYEIHEFSDIKPELGEKHIVSAEAFNGDVSRKYMTVEDGVKQLNEYASETNIQVERLALHEIAGMVDSGTSGSGSGDDPQIYWFEYEVRSDAYFTIVTYASSNINFILEIHRNNEYPSAPWDDSMDDDGNYKQSYFRVTLPSLGFDLYACAAVTQEMKINMRSGACLGCSFPVEVDWEDYKKNFYDSDGNFAPYGQQRNFTKYPNSTSHEITVICKKELDTFGTLMPNIYQQPDANDKFVILGISLPQSYITSAQTRLDNDMKQYMLDNNVHYFEYPLKFDEYFLANHTNILAQMKPNILVRFNFASEQHELYIKQISVKYGEKPLPQYNITLTDDIEIVLSPIGRVTDEVSSLRVLFGGGGSGSGDVNLDLLSEYFLSKQNDDTAAGMIRFLRGLQVGENFVTGLLGEGGIFRVDDDGTTYLECDKLYVRMRAYFDTVEVKKYLHSGGNRIASKAGINCSRVEWIDANGDATNVLEDTVKFRCYFRATSENGREITNDFVVNDLAFCKETNVDNTSIQQHGYWRCVVGVSSSPNEAGEHWIDLSKSDCQSGSNIPLAQDDIIQLGHKTDNTRQGAIVEFVGGEDAPSYQIYQGINSYSLTGKNYVRFGYDSQSGGAQAYIGNPDGSTYLWYHYVTEGGQTFPRLDIKANVQFTSPETTYGTDNLNAFINAITENIGNIQDQVDGNIESWFYDHMPVAEDPDTGAPLNRTPLVNREPYRTWFVADGGDPTTTPVTQPTSTVERTKHLGDTFYDNSSGYAFRFSLNETVVPNVFEWVEIQDSAVIKALADASKAQDTADHKRRVFATTQAHPTPYPPYDVGDLWVNADYTNPETQEVMYTNDMLRCIASKPTKDSEGHIISNEFSINDWQLASKYTDDGALNDFKANQYVQDLTSGTISTGITNAQNAADAAQDAADAAQLDATAAKNRLDNWADDGKISPTEKTALKQQWEDVKKEYLQICADATRYNVSTTSFDSAYTSANAAFTKYTAATPENITIESDYANIATYYSARQTILDSIAYAAKTYAGGYYNDTVLSAIKTALGSALGATTLIDGGLMLTSMMFLRQLRKSGGVPLDPSVVSNYTTWAGVSGEYNDKTEGQTGWAKGNGIAAWFGGDMVDFEMLNATQQAAGWGTGTNQYRYAKTLFRMDGTGYLAGGNIKWGSDGSGSVAGGNLAWNAAGNITYINGQAVQVNGSDVLTATALEDYLPLSAGSTKALTGDLYISNNKFLKWLDNTNTAKTVLGLNSSNTLTIGYDTANAGYGTGIYGNTITFGYGTSRITGIYLNASGNVGIGTGSPSVKLDVNGYAKTTRLYLYKPNANDTNAVYIEYDSTNSGLHLVGAGFYSDSYVSAFGQSSGGGGGVSLNHPLDAINNTAGLDNATLNGQALVYNGSAWKYSNTTGTNLSVGGTLSVTGGISTGGTVTGTMFSGAGFKISGLLNGDNYVLLAGGGTKRLSEIGGGGSVNSITIGSGGTNYTPDASGIVTLPAYLPLSGGEMTGSIIMGTSHYIYGVNETYGSMLHFDGNRTVIGSVGATSTLATHLRSKTGHLTCGTSTTASYTIWDSGNFKPSDYALASSVYSKTEADDKFLYSSSRNSFTPNGTGWYRIGYVGRTALFDFNIWLTYNYYYGHYKYVGSSYENSSWRIIQLYGQYNSNIIPKIRLIYNSSDLRVYIEVYYGNSSSNRDVYFKFFYGSPSDTVTKTADTPADANESVIKEFTGSDTSDGHVVTDTDLENYVTTSALTTTLSGYVTLAGNETISGTKTFTQDVTVQKSGASATKVIAKNDNGTISLYRGNANRGVYDDTLSSWIIYTDGTNTIIPVGNTGIGVTSPTSKLHVNGETKTNNLAITSTSAVAHLIFSRGGNNYITAPSGGNISFVCGGKSVSNANRDMYISDGAVNITGTLNVSSNSTIGGTLEVTGATTLSSTLTVAGTTTLQDHVYISNNKYIYYRDKDDTSYKDVFRLSSNNRLIIGYGIRTLADSYTSIYAGASGMKFFTNGTTERMIITASGLVGIGSTDETNFITEKLNVNGNIKTATSDGTYIQIGGARIVWDNTNKALKVIQSDNLTAANLYATGAVSAFGINSSSSGLSLCTPLNNINSNISDNPTVNGATFVWNRNTSKFVYSNTSGQTLNAYNISVSSALSAYTGSFGSTLEAVNMTVTGGNLTVQTGNLTVSAGRAGIAGETSSSYTLYVHGNIRSNYLAIGATETVNSLSCATIKTLSSRGLSVQTNGNAACYTNVAWSVSSDMRLKHIVSNVGASIEQIADAPIFNFRWLSGGNDTILGSSAQYWQAVFPCAVRGDMNSFLSMDYGGIALAAAVVTARKVVKHEDEIVELKRRVKELEDELKQLKAA